MHHRAIKFKVVSWRSGSISDSRNDIFWMHGLDRRALRWLEPREKGTDVGITLKVSAVTKRVGIATCAICSSNSLCGVFVQQWKRSRGSRVRRLGWGRGRDARLQPVEASDKRRDRGEKDIHLPVWRWIGRRRDFWLDLTCVAAVVLSVLELDINAVRCAAAPENRVIPD